MKQLKDYSDLELKAIAFDEREKIDLATHNLALIRQELIKRKDKSDNPSEVPKV